MWVCPVVQRTRHWRRATPKANTKSGAVASAAQLLEGYYVRRVIQRYSHQPGQMLSYVAYAAANVRSLATRQELSSVATTSCTSATNYFKQMCALLLIGVYITFTIRTLKPC
eukprot:scpid30086/ scgid32007/ 